MASLEQLMQNYLSQRDPNLPVETKRIILKEFLQSYALDYLYNHPDYRKLNFYGGTCLHLLYGLNRLSEDIDLDNSAQVQLFPLADDLLNYFKTTLAYTEVTASTQIGQGGIHRITLKFPILYGLGLTRMVTEPLHLKIEISTHLQTAILQKTPTFVNGKSFVVSHFSVETMMAGKMLACLERKFQVGKSTVRFIGRDYYDLLWFMQQKFSPNREKLVSDGQQPYTIQTAMSALQENVNQIQAINLEEDLLPLFEQRSYITAWLASFKENFARFVIPYLA
jgi:predicted nucleotidyltransferase component of viral defense system